MKLQKNKIKLIAIAVIVLVIIISLGIFLKKPKTTKTADTSNIPKTVEQSDKKVPTRREYVKNEPLTYSIDAAIATSSKTNAAFDYTATKLKSMADECGTQPKVGYFEKLITKFNNVNKTVYTFKHTGNNQEGVYTLTLLPNKPAYISLDQFKKDFNVCSTSGNAYPIMLNSRWLLFGSPCGSNSVCAEIEKVLKPTLKLN